MSKIIITSSGNTTDAIFDRRFARAPWFCIYDEENKTVEFLNNEYKDASEGAGIKVVEKVSQINAEVVISGEFGYKTIGLLDKLSIQMVILNQEDLTVQKIIDRLKN